MDITPDPATGSDDLLATPSGWNDADGDAEGYHWRWDVDSGSGWTAASIAGNAADGPTLSGDHFSAGDRVRVTCTPWDGTLEGAPVTDEIEISNSAPGAPQECAIDPDEPSPDDDLVGSVSGAQDADGDALTYQCQWRVSTDAGATWGEWGQEGATLSADLTSVGECWQMRGRASDGQATGAWLLSDPVEVWTRARRSVGAGTRLMAVPVQPSDPSPASVYPGCQVTGDWTGEGYADAGAIELGWSNWVYFADSMDLDVRGSTAPDDSVGVRVVGAGWHMLGNPFTDTLKWASVQGDNLAPYGWLWDTEASSYRLVGNLDGLNVTSEIPAWSGFWVKLLGEHSDVDMLRGATAPAAMEPMSIAAEAPGDWMIRLTASVGSCSDVDNWVGSLQSGAVRLAGPPTPAGDYVDLYIAPQPGGRDAVNVTAASAATLAWDFVVETNVADAQVMVEYPDLSSVPAEWALYIVDRDTGARQYMQTTSRYVFESGPDGGVRHLRLEAVRETEGQVVLSGVRAMQTSGGVEVSYTLSNPATVEVTILNIAGRAIRTLCNEKLAPAGANSEVWNLVGDRGTRVPAGSYLCRVTARTESGRQASCLATMQIGR